jgi:hypothetical protein
MPESRFVPSLFSLRNWEIPIGSGAKWDDVHKVWEDEDLLSSRPTSPRKIIEDQDDVLGASGEGRAKRFTIVLARMHAHRERIGLPTVNPLPSLDFLGDMAGGQAELAAGVFKEGAEHWLQLRPGGRDLGRNDGAAPLHPIGLPMGRPSAKHLAMETTAFFHRMEKLPTTTTSWYVLQRTLTNQGDSNAITPVRNPAIAFDALNLALREVRGSQQASLPFQGLVPTFRADQPDFDPLMLVALEDRSSAAGPRVWGSSLLKLDLGAEAKGKQLLADIEWFSPTREGFGSTALTGFTLRGTIDGKANPDQFLRTWQEGSGRQIATTFKAMLDSTLPKAAPEASEPPVAQFALRDCRLVAPAASKGDGWLRLGSMELRLLDTPPSKPGEGASLSCEVSGLVGSGATAVYPVSVLRNQRCEIRYAAGGDPRREWATLEGQQVNDERESVPIVSRILEKGKSGKEAAPLQGWLTVKSTYRQGFDATTEMRVEVETDAASSRGSAVWLNLRPFMAALVDFPESETSSVSLLWRSDDPQGAQWRVQDPTVVAVLPPQAVMEEMERGDRFYADATKPDISDLAPVRYRFSPPAYLTLLPSPSEQNRRFEGSPINFRELMRGSHVQRLSFEMAYPLTAVYQRPKVPRRQLVISEAGEFFGVPSERVVTSDGGELPRPLGTFWGTLSAAEKSVYATSLQDLMTRQELVHLNFANRLAELHLLDPTRPRNDLALSEDITFRLRDRALDGVPLADPLPPSSPIDLDKASPAFQRFLIKGGWAQDSDGAVRGGLLHSFEMPSELVEVLETPEAVAGVVEALTLSAIGATGRMEASFASGKTSFAVVAAHGQLSRLVKTRIGRVGALWNKAKHVVVYERSTARSAQFVGEQALTERFDGWPILRKTEEYVEPIQAERDFYKEEQKDSNTTGFIRASVFASTRIYVNSAWARDLTQGYELPLWDRAASEKNPKFYPRPKIFLECFGEEDHLTKLWFREPDRLYFFTSTAKTAGADTDAWIPEAGIDYENLPRWDVTEVKTEALTQRRPANRDLCTSYRFDLAVDSEGPVNLQHGRGKTPILVLLDRVSISRSSQTTPVPIQDVIELTQASATLAATAHAQQSARNLVSTVQDLRGRIEELIAKNVALGDPCSSIAKPLTDEVDAACSQLQSQLNPLRDLDLAGTLTRARDAVLTDYKDISAQLASRAIVADLVIQARTTALRETLHNLRSLIPSDKPALGKELQRALDGASVEMRQFVDDCESRLHQNLSVPTAALRDACDSARIAAAGAALALRKSANNLSANAEVALMKLGEAVAKLDKVPPTYRKSLEPLVGWLQLVSRQLEAIARAATLVAGAAPAVAQKISDALALLVDDVEQLAGLLEDKFANTLDALASTAETQLKALFTDEAIARIDAIAKAVAADQSDLAIAALEAAERALDDGEGRLRARYAQVTSQARSALDKVAAEVVEALYQAAAPSSERIAKRVQEATLALEGLVTTVQGNLHAAISIAAGDCKLLLQGLQQNLQVAQDWVQRQAESAVTDVLSSQAAHQIQRYAQTASKVHDIGSKAISLARGVGALSDLTPLTLDIDVAAFAFDGKNPEIRMSPAVAQVLTQGQELLEAVGIKVPCERLLDQLVPDLGTPGEYKFSEIFKKFAGIDFNGLFQNFDLPKLTSDNIRVTHGFEKSTRRAWVDTNVAFDSQPYQDLFALGPVAVGLEHMALVAFSGVETLVVGTTVQQPVSKTHASLTADWVLLGGGQRLVTFKQVALKYDGASGFDFGLKPENVELHPALKFVSEFIANFKKKVSPAIQIEEEDGRPVGVSAGTTIVIDDLPDLGVVSIGPIDMRSSLGLRLEKHSGLSISTAFSLGNKQAPIFVQISWMGGGCWLETRAKYLDGKVTPSVSVGLSLGAMRAFNLASVAKGSFSVLLYCYIEIGGGGDRIAIGLSMTGSALIVGFVNANVNLLLEASHSAGKTEGTGRLDVEVKISWFYTFRFKRSVNHQF